MQQVDFGKKFAKTRSFALKMQPEVFYDIWVTNQSIEIAAKDFRGLTCHFFEQLLLVN